METDTECPVCHSKNSAIVDKLRAQQESRNQHEEFHNLLERSAEPFSLVAEYFGRGLFNRIVLFDENDLKRSTPQKQNMPKPVAVAPPVARPPTKPVANLNVGEAKTRATENRSNIIAAPKSEARMRLQEQRTDKYSSSLEANIDWSVAKSRGTTGGPQAKKTVVAPSIEQYPKSINPFGEEEAASEVNVKAQSVSKNPFGEEEDSDPVRVKPGVAPTATSSYNPFGEDEDVSNNNNVDNYDQSLNPFGE